MKYRLATANGHFSGVLDLCAAQRAFCCKMGLISLLHCSVNGAGRGDGRDVRPVTESDA
jgi:hypothetical protein